MKGGGGGSRKWERGVGEETQGRREGGNESEFLQGG